MKKYYNNFNSFRILQNNKTLKQRHLVWTYCPCFRILQNNKTLKPMKKYYSNYNSFRILQNNKTLKRQITLKNTMLPHGYFVSVIIVGQELKPIKP